MTLAEVHVKWSVILIDRLGPDKLLALQMKGQVLHRARVHLKVPGWSKSIILKNFKLLQNDSETGTIFSQPPLISFKRDKNIGNFLVRSSFQTNNQIIKKIAGKLVPVGSGKNFFYFSE